MNKADRGTVEQARLLTLEQACQYTNMGRKTCRDWCQEIGAFRKFGSMARYDKHVIDAALDEIIVSPVQAG